MHDNLSKLEYSASVDMESSKFQHSPVMERKAPSEELTSMEFLTVKNTNDDYRTPMKQD